jgi:hypothetical protein
MIASENGHTAVVELLIKNMIKNGCKVNQKTIEGKTALHLGIDLFIYLKT